MSFFIQCPSNTIKRYQEANEDEIKTLLRTVVQQRDELSDKKQSLRQTLDSYSKRRSEAEHELKELRETKKQTKALKKKQGELEEELRSLTSSRDDASFNYHKLHEEEIELGFTINQLQHELNTIEIQVDQNSAHDFEIPLSQWVSLEGEWQMALVQLIYPRSWFNIEEGKQSDDPLHIPNNYIEIKLKESDQKKYFRVIPGFYDTTEVLGRALARGLEQMKRRSDGKWIKDPEGMSDWSQYFFWGFDETRHRFQLTVGKEVEGMRMGEGLKYVLGFDLRKNVWWEGRHTSSHPPDLKAGIESIYVYCDVAEPIMVGDVRAPLLRTVGVTGKSGEVIDATFPDPHYIPVASKYFSRLNLKLFKDDNQPLKFQFGKVVVKLHFRKVK